MCKLINNKQLITTTGTYFYTITKSQTFISHVI